MGWLATLSSSWVKGIAADNELKAHSRLLNSLSEESEPCAVAMRRPSRPCVESPPTLLAANHPVRAHRLFRVARRVRRHDDGFALEAGR